MAKMIEKNDVLHGFRVLAIRDVPEQEGTLYEMVFEQNGAQLLWLKREDDNKSFGVTFPTVPQDDTGVFHILEHSVLNGSEKYRVKEPFVDLLKSSLQTFLNAMTFPDMTSYPVSSRNDQDFLNLIDVYLDAVLHPLCVQDPFTFRQEGWRYEPTGDGIIYNGVVYNEMKGAFASPDEIMETEIDRLLYPDNCYGYVSGGDPAHIPELTYEQFLASYRKHYHPTNAHFFLDGALDIEAVLALIESYLADYGPGERTEAIPLQKPVTPPEKTVRYGITPEEEGEDRVVLAKSWVYGRFDEPEKDIAFAAIQRVLAGTNESPLKKALLEEGLAEDVDLDVMDSSLQHSLLLAVWNTSEEKKDRVEEVLRRVWEEAATGLDHTRLRAVLNKMEFRYREKDYGGTPLGLMNGLNMVSSWIYGGDPLQNLSQAPLFEELRTRIDSGWFEQLIRTYIIESGHRAEVTMLPSTEYGSRVREEEREKLAAVWQALSEDEKKKLAEDFAAFRVRQDQEDDPEATASLPQLKLGDLDRSVSIVPQEVSQIAGRTLLHQPLPTGGILYLNLYFDLSDLETADLTQASFLASLIGQVATAEHDVIALRNEIDSKLGAFGCSATQFADVRKPGDARPYLVVAMALLPEYKEDACALLGEMLNRSDFSNQSYIHDLLRQGYLGAKQNLPYNGTQYARKRALSYCMTDSFLDETMHGLTAVAWMKEREESFTESGAAFCAGLQEMAGKVFTRERVTVSLTGDADPEWLEEVIAVLPAGAPGEPVRRVLPAPKREGFRIPADSGFSASAFSLAARDASYSGLAPLAAQIASYGYLWTAVRVQGGAYDTNLSFNVYGGAAATSYRDPSPARTREAFRGIGSALQAFCASDEPLDRYIISTSGELDPLMTPRLKGLRAAALYLSGRTPAGEQETRDTLLQATKEELAAFGTKLGSAFGDACFCVIGGDKQIEDCREFLDEIRTV
ncbi:MAG: insulinase family protein [Firmicutes bacterium]|nr:insulinase family protein [Bacillota bacterium]